MKRIISFLSIALLLSIMCFWQEGSFAQKRGYWHLGEIRVEESGFTPGDEAYVKGVSYERPYGKYDMALEYNLVEKNGADTKYKGAAKWNPLPNYLIPGREYGFFIETRKMVNTSTQELSISADASHGYRGSSMKDIVSGVKIATNGKFYSNAEASFEALDYKDSDYVVRVKVRAQNMSSMMFEYVYRWKDADLPKVEDVVVLIDNEQLVMDVPPLIIEDRLVVPLRSIFEALGSDVEWNAQDRSIRATKGSTVIFLKVDDENAKVNDVSINLDVPPTIVENRTLVPVRIVAESFGANVTWDGESRTVSIKSKY